jgi:hypothetical protein
MKFVDDDSFLLEPFNTYVRQDPAGRRSAS